MLGRSLRHFEARLSSTRRKRGVHNMKRERTWLRVKDGNGKWHHSDEHSGSVVDNKHTREAFPLFFFREYKRLKKREGGGLCVVNVITLRVYTHIRNKISFFLYFRDLLLFHVSVPCADNVITFFFSFDVLYKKKRKKDFSFFLDSASIQP